VLSWLTVFLLFRKCDKCGLQC